MKRLIHSERFSHDALRIGVALSIFWWGGCSSRKEKDTGNISGKLTISGEPLPAGGDVTFMSREGIGGTSKVSEGGLYAISKIPVGTYKVVVIPPPLPHPHENKRGQGRGPGAEKYPMKYQADNSSDLSSEIKKGDQTQDFDLKPGDASPGGGRKRKP